MARSQRINVDSLTMQFVGGSVNDNAYLPCVLQEVTTADLECIYDELILQNPSVTPVATTSLGVRTGMLVHAKSDPTQD